MSPATRAWAPPPAEPFAAAALREPRGLRIAATTLPPIPEAVVDPLCARAVSDAADLLRELGHTVEEVDPPWQVPGIQELFGAVFSTHISLSIAYSAIVAGREPTAADMEPMSWAIYSMISDLNAVEGMGATVRLETFTRQLVAFLEGYDVLLTPALAQRPLPLGTLDTGVPEPMQTFTRSGLFTPFTPIFNASGQPGISRAAVRGRGPPAAGGAAGRAPSRRGAAAGAGHAARSRAAVGRRGA